MMHSTQIHFARENLIFNSNSAQKNVSLFICFGKNYLFVWANSGRIMVLLEKYLPLQQRYLGFLAHETCDTLQILFILCSDF